MKATGIVRKLDNLGRIVIPAKLRKDLNINIKDDLEMFVGEDGSIILDKYVPKCTFCSSEENVSERKGKNMCEKCFNALKSL